MVSRTWAKVSSLSAPSSTGSTCFHYFRYNQPASDSQIPTSVLKILSHEGHTWVKLLPNIPTSTYHWYLKFNMFKTEPGFFFENTATFSSPLQLLTQKLESSSTSLSSMIHYIPFISNQIQFSTPEMLLESIHCPPPHATPHDPPGLHCPHPSSRWLTSPTALLHLTPKIPLKRCISRTMRNFLMASFYT